jgi:multiple sugar transport system substrate-binding protein
MKKYDLSTLKYSVTVAIVFSLIFTLLLPSFAMSEEKVTITWAINSDPQRQPWAQSVAKKYEELHSNIKINLLVIPWNDFDSKINTLYAAGTPVDIWTQWGASGIGDFYYRGMLMDLTPYLKKDKFDLSDFLPSVVNMYKFGGKIYGIPIYSVGSYLYYNKKLFDEAGIAYPPSDWEDKSWTMDKFLEIAQKLTKDYGTPQAQYGVLDGLWPHNAWPLLFGQDIFPTSAYRNGKADTAYLTHPRVVEAIQFLQDLTYKYKVSPTPAMQQGMAAAGNPFYTGRIAMYLTGGWGWWVLKGLEKKFPWGAAALPRGATNIKDVTFSDPWVIAKTTKHPDEVWEFWKFLTSKEVIGDFMERVGAIPSRKSLLSAFYNSYPSIPSKDVETSVIGSLKYGIESPNHLMIRYDKIDSFLKNNFDLILLNKESASNVLKDMQPKFVKLLQEITKE